MEVAECKVKYFHSKPYLYTYLSQPIALCPVVSGYFPSTMHIVSMINH